MSAPAVAVSPDGKKFVAAWMDKRAGKNDLNVYWTLADGPRFSRDALVHEETRGVQNHPAVAIDRSGTSWVAWEDDHGGAPAIWVRSSARGSKGQLLSDPSEGAPAFPAIAAGAGLVGVAYEAVRDGDSRIIFHEVAGAASGR